MSTFPFNHILPPGFLTFLYSVFLGFLLTLWLTLWLGGQVADPSILLSSFSCTFKGRPDPTYSMLIPFKFKPVKFELLTVPGSSAVLLPSCVLCKPALLSALPTSRLHRARDGSFLSSSCKTERCIGNKDDSPFPSQEIVFR